MSCLLFFGKQFLKSIKLFVYAFTFGYFVYIRTRSINTNNWIDTRELGYREINKCRSPGKLYGVYSTFDLNDDFFNNFNDIPLCYYRTKINSKPKLCFSNYYSIYNISKSVPYEDLDQHISDNQTNYFPFFTSIMFFSSLGLALIVLFEYIPTNRSDIENENRFSTSRDEFNAKRLIFVFMILLISLLISSSLSFSFMKDEKCINSSDNNNHHHHHLLVRNYCKYLSSLSVKIASVINPSEPAIYNFPYFCQIFSAFFGLAAIIEIYKKDLGLDNIDLELPMRVNRDEAYEDVDEDGLELPEQRRRNPRSSNQENNNAIELPKPINWKTIAYSDKIGNQECTICLETFEESMQPSFKVKHKLNDDEEAQTEDTNSFSNVKPRQSSINRSIDAFAPVDKIIPVNENDLFQSFISDMKKKDIVQLNCGHLFHKNCINKWLNSNSNATNSISCPNCRANLNSK